MNHTIMRKINVTGDFQALSDVRLIGSFEISALPSNIGAVIFRGENGEGVPWNPGEYHSFFRVDLAKIFVKGAIGDSVTVIGGTW
jgi:hypothetical protein